jgi:hypothetical protein
MWSWVRSPGGSPEKKKAEAIVDPCLFYNQIIRASHCYSYKLYVRERKGSMDFMGKYVMQEVLHHIPYMRLKSGFFRSKHRKTVAFLNG